MKEKWVYGFKQYLRPTPAKVKRFLLAWKGIIGSTAIVAMADANWKIAIGIGILGFVVNELALFVGETMESAAAEKAKNEVKDIVSEVTKEIKEENYKEEFKEEIDANSTK